MIMEIIPINAMIISNIAVISFIFVTELILFKCLSKFYKHMHIHAISKYDIEQYKYNIVNYRLSYSIICISFLFYLYISFQLAFEYKFQA